MPLTDTAALARSVPEIVLPVPVKYERRSAVESLMLLVGATEGIETCRTFASGIGPIPISCEVQSYSLKERLRILFFGHL